MHRLVDAAAIGDLQIRYVRQRSPLVGVGTHQTVAAQPLALQPLPLVLQVISQAADLLPHFKKPLRLWCCGLEHRLFLPQSPQLLF